MKNLRKLVILCVLLALCAILGGCAEDTVTVDVIKNSLTDQMRTYTLHDFAQKPVEHLLNVNQVTVSSTEKTEGGVQVYAEVAMSDADMRVTAYYRLLYRKSGNSWRLDSQRTYRQPEITASDRDQTRYVQEYYAQKFGNLTLVGSPAKDQDQATVYRFAIQNKHRFVDETNELVVRISFYTDAQGGYWDGTYDLGEAAYVWNVNGQWNFYPYNNSPESYGKNDFFSDVRYLFTVKTQNGQTTYTVDRFSCKDGVETHTYTISGTAVQGKSNQNYKPALICYDEDSSWGIWFEPDGLYVGSYALGRGYYDAYPV